MSTASRFLGSKMVLASIRCSGSFSHHIINFRILTRTQTGTACSCFGVRPSGLGAINKSSLLAFIFPSVIGSRRASSVDSLVRMDPTSGSVITSCQWDYKLFLGGCNPTYRALDLLQVLCVSEYSIFSICLLIYRRATNVLRRRGTLVSEGSTSINYSESCW